MSTSLILNLILVGLLCLSPIIILSIAVRRADGDSTKTGRIVYALFIFLLTVFVVGLIIWAIQ